MSPLSCHCDTAAQASGCLAFFAHCRCAFSLCDIFREVFFRTDARTDAETFLGTFRHSSALHDSKLCLVYQLWNRAEAWTELFGVLRLLSSGRARGNGSPKKYLTSFIFMRMQTNKFWPERPKLHVELESTQHPGLCKIPFCNFGGFRGAPVTKSSKWLQKVLFSLVLLYRRSEHVLLHHDFAEMVGK